MEPIFLDVMYTIFILFFNTLWYKMYSVVQPSIYSQHLAYSF